MTRQEIIDKWEKEIQLTKRIICGIKDEKCKSEFIAKLVGISEMLDDIKKMNEPQTSTESVRVCRKKKVDICVARKNGNICTLEYECPF